MELTDTHCHIHSDFFKADPEVAISEGKTAGVTRAICVGTDLKDSKAAVRFVKDRAGLWASIGIHPHEAKDYTQQTKLDQLAALANKPKVVAVGECGLDFYYNHSSQLDQERLLRRQIEIAVAADLPLIFHVRDAFDRFWEIFDEYKGIRGEIHSFTADQNELDRILAHGLYVGLNGIMTFTKNSAQLEAAKAVPIDKLLLETDAPFLTPAPFRGIICQLKHIRVTAEFLANLRGQELSKLASATTKNTKTLFNLT